jgi:hypothetical protein
MWRSEKCPIDRWQEAKMDNVISDGCNC